MRPSEVGAFKMRPAEVGLAEVGLAELGPAEVGSVEECPTKVGSAEVGRSGEGWRWRQSVRLPATLSTVRLRVAHS
jgi:hypothetical protein